MYLSMSYEEIYWSNAYEYTFKGRCDWPDYYSSWPPPWSLPFHAESVKQGDTVCFPVKEMATAEDPGKVSAWHRMLSHIASSKAPIKSQQRGEDDLSSSEKLSILSELLDQKPAIFLERFHSFLTEEHLDVFQHLLGDYKIEFYLNEARKRLNAGKLHAGVRNRRYEALKKLEKEGVYFEDSAMKDRDPLMFEEYIGQYLTEEERKGLLKPIDHGDLKFSSILMTFMDEQETKELLQRQKDEEDEMMEEDEEEEDYTENEDDDSGINLHGASSSDKQPSTLAEREPTPATVEEKAMLRHEFLLHMHQRFLSGQEDFNYAAVDSNVEYDSLVLRGQDEEERYFDEEEEETWSLQDDERTGSGCEFTEDNKYNLNADKSGIEGSASCPNPEEQNDIHRTLAGIDLNRDVEMDKG